MNTTFTLNRTVMTEDIDELHHVNNVVYVEWVQDIAKKHWAFLTQNQSLSNYIWVLIKHEIDYLNQAVLNDSITINTWVSELTGAKCIRHVEVYKDKTLLVKSKTTWCLLNAKTYKPLRIPNDILNLMAPSL